MAVQTKTGIPAIIECGDTVIFTESLSDYPTTGWTSALIFSLNGTTITPVAGSVSNGVWTFTLSTSFTDALTPGEYLYAIYMTETATSQRERAQTGVVNFIPNLAETRTATAAETSLAAVNAALDLLIASPDASVSFNGQSVTSKDVAALSREQVRLKAAVLSERKKADALRGIRKSDTIGTMFIP